MGSRLLRRRQGDFHLAGEGADGRLGPGRRQGDSVPGLQLGHGRLDGGAHFRQIGICGIRRILLRFVIKRNVNCFPEGRQRFVDGDTIIIRSVQHIGN